ncbi:hypothetical protein HPB47_014502 [Ixodes persulcatus]|uniref:Uncharacterized protein n=1 Tax=Ixodes persulcatus TaxID=34615 RepID=A0AC60QYD2_IXOPE|nr:hypothetical protein HPB47_014502 [Ixodes persulcatus]
MKRLLVLGVLIWTAVTSLIFLQISQSRLQNAIHAQAEILERDVRSQLYSNEEVLDLLKRWKSVDEARKTRREVIAVLVLAYNRLSVESTLKQLLRYRPHGIWFPVVLSQDGFHEKTADLLREYQERHGFQLIHQPDQTELTKGVSAIFNIEGYHRIARHYRKGVSEGQFFDKYLKDVHLSSVFVKFGSIDLTYLLQHRYDPAFDAAVRGSSLRNLEDLLDSRVTQGPVRITYTNEQHFKVIANYLDIMGDFKAGVPRTAYKGIVSTYYNGVRVFIVPRAQQTTSTLSQRARSNEAVSG